MDAGAVAKILSDLEQSKDVVVLGTGDGKTFVTSVGWMALEEKAGQLVFRLSREFPLRAGMPREELKSRLGLPPRVFDQVMDRSIAETKVEASGDMVRVAGFAVRFDPDLKPKIDALLSEFVKSPYAPPQHKKRRPQLEPRRLPRSSGRETLFASTKAFYSHPLLTDDDRLGHRNHSKRRATHAAQFS